MSQVSVIVPSYNHAPFLVQRIESILNQSFSDFEVILLDDRSSDNSVEILNRYRGCPRVSHTVINETNSGSPFIQWQKGISLARGQYIWIAESDDWSDPDFLKTMVMHLQTYPDAVFAYSGTILVENDQEALYQYDRLRFGDSSPFSHSFTMNGIEFRRDFLSRMCVIPNVSAVIFRSDALRAVNLSELAGFRKSGDWLLYWRLCEKGMIVSDRTPLNYFRRHSEQTTDMSSDRYYAERQSLIRLFSKSNWSKKDRKAFLNDVLLEIIGWHRTSFRKIMDLVWFAILHKQSIIIIGKTLLRKLLATVNPHLT